MRIAEQALQHWGLSGAKCELVAERENRVYRVTTADKSYALRLHRPGYRTDAELKSELDWMAQVSRSVSVPIPIAAKDGAFLKHVGGTQIDMLSWLSGNTLEKEFPNLRSTDRSTVFHTLGQQMATLHQSSDGWSPPNDFKRCFWDEPGLIGEAPLWDKFWRNPLLDTESRRCLLVMRSKAAQDFKRMGHKLEYGLIHADLVLANVMRDDAALHLIDFDDGGYGYRLFDIATSLCKLIDAPDYSDLKASLIAGYTSVRPIDLAHFDLFMALRAATYVGWNITRMSEKGAAERNQRFIDHAVRLARIYLDATA